MKLSEIKQTVIDKTKDSGIDDTMLTIWINVGYQDVVNKLINLYESYFGATATISIESDTQEYDLDDLCRKVVRVEDENKGKIFRVSIDDNDNSVDGYYLFGDKIGFKPLPTESKTWKYFFIKQPADLVYTASPLVDDIPAFPSSYHYLLVLWAMKEYYEEQQDINYATHYFNEYNSKLAELINEMKNRNEDENKYAKPKYSAAEDKEWQD